MIVRNCGSPVPIVEGLSDGLCRPQFSTRYGFARRGSGRSTGAGLSEEWRRGRHSSTSAAGLGRVSHQPRYLPPIRALRSREDRRREPDEFPPTRSSPRAPIPDLDDADLEDLPSLYKARRREPSPGRENGAGGGSGGGYFGRNNGRGPPGASPPSTSWGSNNKYVLGGLFVLGVGAGIALDTVVNIEPSNVASREVIDRQTPNPDVCIANGMSAMVLDQRLFITFNPFNVYVSQAEVKPGCVLRQSNWRVLESRGLVNSEEVRDCKRNFNTFGFVGDLRQAPEINCVYHSENAENQFLKDPSKAALGDGFQPKDFTEP
ncbi:unnamed protein product [Calypogeia fissa]